MRKNSASTSSLDKQSGKNTGLVSFKVGIVEESKVGWAVVRFPDLGDMLSKWIPQVWMNTQDDKEYGTLDVGSMVKCLMDDRLEDGCILGAIYSQVDVPPTTDKDERGIKFKDGGWVKYNRATGIATVIAPTKVVLDTPLVHCTGDVQVDGTLTADVDCVSAGVSGKGHIHLIIVPTPGMPVTPPVV